MIFFELNKSGQNSEFNKIAPGDRLSHMIGNLPPVSVTLPELRDILGQEGLLLFAAFLSLIFLIPVSIPGLSTVFGTAILLIGLSRLGERKLWLPEFLYKRQLPSESLRNGLNRGLIWFRRLEKISRPDRLRLMTVNKASNLLNNCSIVLGAVLLMAPFGFVPFSNTLPAVALLFISIGILQHDGLSVLIGHITNIVTIIYFAVLITGGGFLLNEMGKRLF